ncbi:MAG: YibE/F family protein [Actinobacteria bacterium]|nr:YibE/F family protein [Actinomycetota bacterium]
MKSRMLFLLLLLLVIFSIFLTSCNNENRYTIEQWEKIEEQRLKEAQEEIQYRGKVLDIISDETQKLEGGLESRLQILEVRITNGAFKNEIIEVENYIDPNSAYNIIVNKGDGIFLITEVDKEDHITVAYVTEIIRDKYLIFLTVAFIITLILVGRFKGLKAAIALALTAIAVVKILLPLILKGYNPILISAGISIGIIIITLTIIGGFNRKTLSTIIGTSGGIFIAGILALIFGNISKLTGLSSEEARMLMFIPQEIDFNFRGLLFSGIILASLGAVMDVSMSISSSMFEVIKVDPTIKKNDLMSAGMSVGRDIIGTMSNTLILVYIGSSLPLMLLFMAYDISFIEIVNKDMIASEIIRALAGSIGLILAIPITVLVSANLFNREYIRSARHK